MCGRFTLFVPAGELGERFEVSVPDSYAPSYNVAPGEAIPVIATDDPDALQFRTWGLVPAWADEPDGGQINARAETIEERPSFRDAVARRRCLVPADGFYEWTDGESGRQPYRIAYEDDRPFAMAGIWERWEGVESQAGLGDFAGGSDGPDAVVRETVSIVTTEAVEPVTALHDRMPVVLPRADERAWLDAEDPEQRADLLQPLAESGLRTYPVSRAVNDPGNDDPALVEPI